VCQGFGREVRNLALDIQCFPSCSRQFLSRRVVAHARPLEAIIHGTEKHALERTHKAA
jgi:hypothetical protein